MKLKLLLFLLLFGGILNAQDTIRSLVISEAFIGRQYRNHIEITNMGDDPVQLSQFIMGRCNNVNNMNSLAASSVLELPDKMLQPGESFLVMDYCDWMVDVPEEGWNVNEREMMGMPKEWEELGDLFNYRAENLWGEPRSSLDSVSPPNYLAGWWGRDPIFIEQMFNDTDGVVIDQVGGIWDRPDGSGRQRGLSYEDSYAVAGYASATSQARLIRKASVTTGNLDFATARGVGEDDSEWIAIPFLFSPNRLQPWTLKTHGDYNLDANTLEPMPGSGVEVDFAAKKIMVPWGTRKPDGIMQKMMPKPGVAWYYHSGATLADSLTFAAQTGDTLEVLVAGIDLDRANFVIEVKDPSPSANIVVPGIPWDQEGVYMDAILNNFTEWPVVTMNESGMDTIRGYKTQHYSDIPNPDYWYGIPYATRIDTLAGLLEKPANANWEIVFVDGVERPDLKNGDILKVTAEDGSVKEYYIKVQDYVGSINTNLSSITWPDIPEFYKGLFGWVGDTIPAFDPFKTEYIVKVPQIAEGIPALVAKTVNNNATVEVTRAINLFGTVADKTTLFEVVAENDTISKTFKVQLEKEKLPQNVEPYAAEPFFSKLLNGIQFGNSYLEICNPGTLPLDLSDYMLVHNYANGDPQSAITMLAEAMDEEGNSTWLNRYSKYVPGYKWVNEGQWQSTPARLEPDLGVDPVVDPGDVFILAEIERAEILWRLGYTCEDWKPWDQIDVQFRDSVQTDLCYFDNPWGEDVNNVPLTNWGQSNLFLFKILNDSVKLGLKPASDPLDFELIETFGMADGSDWDFTDPVTNATGNANIDVFIRRPEINKPNPLTGANMGILGSDSCEWIRHDHTYFSSVGVYEPLHQAYPTVELGNHYYVIPTEFMSTVGSNVYKVSPGYGMEEEISGVVTGTIGSEFIENIIKYDEGQTLTLLSGADGSELAMDAALSLNDTLMVLSADSVNTTKYALQVTETGLSSDAVLTSDVYTVEVTTQPTKSAGEDGAGIVSGMEYGTTLVSALNNIDVPMGAKLTIIDGNGAYVPLKTLTLDTSYVNTSVSPDVYLEVIAEDMVTTIVYQMWPQATDDDAFITSDVLDVDQSQSLISNVPGGMFVAGDGINVSSLLALLVPSPGATMILVDKAGNQRMDGKVIEDDKVVVTSASGINKKVYHLAFIPNAVVKSVTYLAYILSDAYMVDQVSYMVDVDGATPSVSEFMGNITASMGATAMVVDSEGAEKTTGNIAEGDMVKVTSADGKIVVMYEVGEITSTRAIDARNIRLYPNPTSAEINISGLETGGRIRVFNALGTQIRDVRIQRNIEIITLNDQPSGLYLIVVSDTEKMLGRYKVLKK